MASYLMGKKGFWIRGDAIVQYIWYLWVRFMFLDTEIVEAEECS